MDEGFTMKLCSNKAAWQIVPENITSIDLEKVGRLIEEAGYEVGLQTRLCWTFSGLCDLTLYPSGKLLVKSEDEEIAAAVAEQHVSIWAHA
tara:strand:- start:738 stop:1010 length:273 start_codon:yes stop_codon:yes gene_type:complete